MDLGNDSSPLASPAYVLSVLLRMSLTDVAAGNFDYTAFTNVGRGATATAPTKAALYALFETEEADTRIVLTWDDSASVPASATLQSDAIAEVTVSSFDCSASGTPNYCPNASTRPRGGGVAADGRVMFAWQSGATAERPHPFLVFLTTDMTTFHINAISDANVPLYNPSAGSDAAGTIFASYSTHIFNSNTVGHGFLSFDLTTASSTVVWRIPSDAQNGPIGSPNQHGQFYRMRPVQWSNGANQVMGNAAYFLGGNCPGGADVPCFNVNLFNFLFGKLVKLTVNIVDELTLLPVQTSCQNAILTAVEGRRFEGDRPHFSGVTQRYFAGSYDVSFGPLNCQVRRVETTGAAQALSHSRFALTVADSSPTVTIVLKVISLPSSA